MKKLILLFFGLVFLFPEFARATHFRFGNLSWQPGETPGEVEFKLVNAFRRADFTYPGSHLDGFAQTGDIIHEHIGGTYFDFGDGDSTFTLEYIVTSYSIAEDYIICEALDPVTGERGIRHTYSANGPYYAGISSCCRISSTPPLGLNNRDNGNYVVQTIVYPNTGNRSPITSLFPVITVPETNNVNFLVPAVDPDGDQLRWRISSDSEAGGGSGPPNVSINPNTGIFTWNNLGLNKENYWTVQVIIEDLTTNGVVKTQTPVDFLLKIGTNTLNNPPACTISPSSVVNAYINTPVSFIVHGSDPDTNDFVTLNTTGLPVGATMTPPLPYMGNTNQAIQSTFSWTPGNQGGSYQLLFSAFDSYGYQTLAPVTIAISPVLVSGGTVSLVSEGCNPTNGVIDPGETVTVNFPIGNLGALSTTNLVATLLPSSGVHFPSAPQFYGAVSSNAPVSKPFTFRANGPCYGTIKATLQLNEGANDLGTIEYQIFLGPPPYALKEDFDTIFAPVLASGWISTNGIGTNAGFVSKWTTTTATRDTSPNAAYVNNPASGGRSDLDSPSFLVPASGAQLSFRHSFNTATNDFCSVQISITNGPFTSILAAGGIFLTNGFYTTNGWFGNSGGFITTLLDMPPASLGRNVRLRWRMAATPPNGGAGWWVDTIRVSRSESCCLNPADVDVGLFQTVSANPALLGSPVTYTVDVVNTGPATATGVIVTNILPDTVNFVSATSSQGTFFRNGNVLRFNLGTLTNATASIEIVATPFAEGLITNKATVIASEYDSNDENNAIELETDVQVGLIINNVNIVEGNSGVQMLNFNCQLMNSSQRFPGVAYATEPGSAQPLFDFGETSGMLLFGPFQTSLNIQVPIYGDTTNELNETFNLNFFNATNVILVNTSAVVTILNDDANPNVVLTDFQVTAENCPSLNQAPDANETVTVNVTLQNLATGTAEVTNLVVTLNSGGGVTAFSGPQNFGSLLPNGAAVTRPFTFKASGSCGGAATATFQLQDGTTTLQPIVYTFDIGKRIVPLAQNFDGVAAPVLPVGWSTQGSGTTNNWRTTIVTNDSPYNAVFVPISNTNATADLISPTFLYSSVNAQLIFRHAYNLLGATNSLLMSVNGGPFQDVQLNAIFATNAYNTTFGWTGNSQGFITTILDLPTGFSGQSIKLRWRTSSSVFSSGAGWYVDSIMVSDGFDCCSSASTPPLLTTQISGNAVWLYWPTSSPNYVIDFATNLTPPVNWLPLTNPVNISGGNYSVSNHLIGSGKFFRLRQ